MTGMESTPPASRDLAAFRAQFPALRTHVWLNTAGVAPGGIPVLAALRRAIGEWEDGTFSFPAWEEEAEATRGLFARLIGADERSIAFVESLAEAAATVAQSLPDGKVVVGEREFRSNLFPWLALGERGRQVVAVPPVDGVVRTDDLLAAIDERTVLVAITEVQSTNGFRARLGDIAARCRGAGARLFVNLTQSLGALRFDVAEAQPDFVAAHGYKWLLAPRGAAWLYVRPDRLAEMVPLAANWKSIEPPVSDYYGGPYALSHDARKLDVSLAWFPWVGAKAALELLLSMDRATVERQALWLAATFREGARARGLELTPEELPSHIVGLAVPNPDAVLEELSRRRIVVSVRGGYVRLGFHGFNSRDDVDAALEALDGASARPGV